MSEVTLITGGSGTSSGGNMIARSLRVICLTGAFYIGGTHSAVASSYPSLYDPAFDQTNSGLAAEQTTPVGPAIMELRRLSGMTWEQLASLFEVSRRTVHFWASGKALNSYNEEKLYQTLSTIRQIDRGTAQENRELLFTAQAGSRPPIELIRSGHYAEVVRLFGQSTSQPSPLTPLSDAAWNARRPASPEKLVGALHDAVQVRTGRTRMARTLRVKNKTQGDNS